MGEEEEEEEVEADEEEAEAEAAGVAWRRSFARLTAQDRRRARVLCFISPATWNPANEASWGGWAEMLTWDAVQKKACLAAACEKLGVERAEWHGQRAWDDAKDGGRIEEYDKSRGWAMEYGKLPPELKAAAKDLTRGFASNVYNSLNDPSAGEWANLPTWASVQKVPSLLTACELLEVAEHEWHGKQTLTEEEALAKEQEFDTARAAAKAAMEAKREAEREARATARKNAVEAVKAKRADEREKIKEISNKMRSQGVLEEFGEQIKDMSPAELQACHSGEVMTYKPGAKGKQIPFGFKPKLFTGGHKDARAAFNPFGRGDGKTQGGWGSALQRWRAQVCLSHPLASLPLAFTHPRAPMCRCKSSDRRRINYG